MNRQAQGPWIDGYVDSETRHYGCPVLELPGRVQIIVHSGVYRGSTDALDTVKLLRAIPELVAAVMGDNLDEARHVLALAGVE